jgi:hypothetical protein
MRTIRLELLRHGPPHNQLLSPLTNYLALCENHPAATLQVPFEHAEFMVRLRALQSTAGALTTGMSVEDMARPITGVLSSVPGLIRELAENAGDASPLFHLRLILSANELALLPFELADAPPGFVGAGQAMLLQSQAPVCITREVRRVSVDDATFNDQAPPYILVVASTAAGAIPLEAHLTALRQVIEPWMRFYLPDAEPRCEQERRQRVSEHLKVIPDASIRDIEEACATGRYTHVHILAHGVPLKKGDDRRYGLALHHPSQLSKVDVVDGAQLAKALRPPLKTYAPGFARPSVVTLAACDAGSVGSVVGAGASIAHALHEDGIPLVVASQLPLSFAGSVIMVRELYKGFLVGQDPRTLLVGLRRQLRTQAPTTYDWASIVAYASFPPSLETQLREFQIKQAQRRLEAAFHHADRMLLSLEGRQQSSARMPTRPPKPDEIREQRLRLDEDSTRLESLLSAEPGSLALGLLASSEKRLAQLLYRMDEAGLASLDHTMGDRLSLVRATLLRSRKYYYRAFHKDRQPWALVQALVLTAVLGPYTQESIGRDEWELARILSEEELKSTNRQQLAWANANLMELYVLVPVIPKLDVPAAKASKEARRYLQAFMQATDEDRIEVYSTRRQLERYPGFFAEINSGLHKVANHAAQLVKLLPESRLYG